MSQIKNKKYPRRTRRQLPWPLLMLIGGGLFLLVGAVFALNRPTQPKAPIEVTGAPSLKVDRQEIDLGDVPLGRTVRVSFQLTNVGDRTLRFAQAPYVEIFEGC